MRKIFFLFILFFQAVCTVVYSNNNQIVFDHISVKDGLASTYVKGISQDKDGFIWIITRENICRFDGVNFKEFPVFNQNEEQVKLLPNAMYMFGDTLLLCESMDNYYYYFDFKHEQFKPFLQLYSPIKKSELCCLNENELIFIQGNELCKLNLQTNSIVISDLFKTLINVSSDTGFVSTYANNMYLFAATNTGEMLELDKRTGKQKKYTFPKEYTNDELDILHVDDKNNIWFRVYNYGLNRFIRETGELKHFKEGSDNPILHDLVYCILTDDMGRAWIGNENGLCIWDEENDKMYNYQYDKLYPQGLNTNPIYNAFKDKDGHIWLGTYFGGINLWNSNTPFFKSWTAGQSPYHLVGNVVSSFAEDPYGNLWIGTVDMGVNKLNLNTGIIEKGEELNKLVQLSYNNVHNLTFVDENTLWIATYSGGIDVFNIKTKQLDHINTSTYSNMPSNFVYTLIKVGDIVYIGGIDGAATYNLKTKQMEPFFPDKLVDEGVVSFAKDDEKLWIASSEGVFSYGFKDEKFTSYKQVFESSGVNQVVCDSKNQIWVATNSLGLIKVDDENQSFTYYNESTGFPVNRIFAFVEGNNGSLWVSTNKGLINFRENSDQYYLYDNNSGGSFTQFNFRAGYKDKNGQIYFGGNSGMVAFNEKDSINNKQNDIVFTEFALFNKTVAPGEKAPIKTAINNADKIVLQYKQNVFTINFAAINYTQFGQNMYAYKLEGFDKEYNYVGNRNNATYTNLNPGEYIFKVKTSNNSWRNESEVKSIPIIIKPPLWRSSIAYAIYIILLMLGLIAFYSITSSIQKSKAAIEIERREKHYIEEMNQAKLEFFTNISHEIKTPLTLILGPLVRLLKEENIPFMARKSLQGIYRNVRRLNTLLMELLEFRKIERGSMKLNVSRVSDFDFMKDIELDFGNLATKRNVVFEIEYPKNDVDLWYNQPILEKVIYNLLSNAFKYGVEGNYVACKIAIEHTTIGTEESKMLHLTVADKGKGINAKDVEKLFERFYQVSDEKSFAQGVGIGLSFVKSLVDLHRGEISIKSEPDKGCVFTVLLPASKNQFSEEELCTGISTDEKYLTETDSSFYNTEEVETKTDSIDLLRDKPVIQIVDDNVELLSFIKELLADKYVIHTAENGKVAYEKIQKNNPELIISDVMMPVMDGFELTKKIKQNIETSHIPIVLLTAKGGDENCFEGLKYGADLYIEKPFYPPIFEQNISNILTTRHNFRSRFNNDLSIAPSETVHSVRDKEFISKLTEVIIANIDKPNVDVTFLVEQLNISRSLLHMKLKSLVNCSTTEFVRNIRMRKAMELITKENCSYSEAGYRTGFSSPAYFSRCFKEIYGKSPREYFKKDTA